MATIDYSKVITDAISHFGAIQNALANKKVVYGGSVVSSKNIPTGVFAGIITDQLSLNPEGTLSITKSGETTTVKSSGQGYAVVSVPEISNLSHTLTFGTSSINEKERLTSGKFIIDGKEVECDFFNVYNTFNVKTSVATHGWFTGDATGKSYIEQQIVAKIPVVKELTAKVASTPSTLSVSKKTDSLFSITAEKISVNSITSTFSGYFHSTDTNAEIVTDGSNIYVGDLDRAQFDFQTVNGGKQVYCKVPGYIEKNAVISFDFDGDNTPDVSIDDANVIVNVKIGELNDKKYPVIVEADNSSTIGLWLEKKVGQVDFSLPEGEIVGKDITTSATLTATSTTTNESTAAISTAETDYKVVISTETKSHALAQVAVQGYFPTETTKNIVHDKTATSGETFYLKEATFAAVSKTADDISIKSNTTSPSSFGMKALTTSSSESVTVEAVGRPRVKVGSAGHTKTAGSEVDYTNLGNITATANIPAAQRTASNSLGTVNTSSSSISKTATVFNVGTTTATKQASDATFATTVTVEDSAVKDKYLISSYRGSKAISGQEVTIPADATGESVDKALLELVKCINGFDYTTI